MTGKRASAALLRFDLLNGSLASLQVGCVARGNGDKKRLARPLSPGAVQSKRATYRCPHCTEPAEHQREVARKRGF